MQPLNDSGIAYGFYMAIFAIIIFGFILALLSPLVNILNQHNNQFIQNGDESIQTKMSVQWAIGGFVFSIIVTLLGVFYWVVVRANEQKQYGGGMG